MHCPNCGSAFLFLGFQATSQLHQVASQRLLFSTLQPPQQHCVASSRLAFFGTPTTTINDAQRCVWLNLGCKFEHDDRKKKREPTLLLAPKNIII